MPELPEVETICRALRPLLIGKVIHAVEVKRRDLRRPVPDDFSDNVQGQTILSLARRGKFLLWRLTSGKTILMHLGMSGRLQTCTSCVTADEQPVADLKHAHLSFFIADGLRVHFIDPRRFGLITLLDSAEETQFPALKRLGMEPTVAEFTFLRFHTGLKRRHTSIKAALMAQEFIAGLGNIYVCEALYHAEIHPMQHVETLELKAQKRLFAAIKYVLDEAIAAGGSTLRDFKHPDGRDGAYRDIHRVYGRAHQPCPACPSHLACPGVQRITQNGRSSFYCPSRQKLFDSQSA